ncbi:two-component system, NtrC family, response regulator AlgB [Prosthecobacter fusiformis]|uniref:Two-component system, NtrC family, response regulator AlgB n=1 Tax=Prosthecobacter fusiformis TaxID=48464 RepID=A0A4R7RXN7_9BACT|nr:sigma-54 dependent transcriptional regulator [Prosthecobacter fusiformis]TDU69317.1 two-component system, NtrC family, response regulator AlgB [Prosthecobacter fusiformis]
MDFLVIDDERSIRDATCMLIDDEGHYAEPVVNSASALTRLKEEKYDAILLDLKLGAENGLDVLEILVKQYPQIPVVMFTAQGTVKTAVEAVRRGALDFLEKPFTREEFRAVLARLNRFRQMSQRIETLEKEVQEVRQQNGPEPRFDFETPAMKSVMDVLMRAAKAPAAILILGESGTGKSVVARAIHEQSHLHDKPFVTVSCPSLSKELLQSDLFGHVKGSFTGAVRDTWGKIKQAEGGTLFLDEIGELPLEIQPQLLRLLQEREYERVGETVTRKADVRVIAATNRDLKECVRNRTFREDLYFRLNVISVEMPPLRQRQDDLLRFAEYYTDHFAHQVGRKLRGISATARQRIMSYPWPGNLRELRNAIERAVILSSAEQLEATDLPSEVHDQVDSSPALLNTASNVTGNAVGSFSVQALAGMTLEQVEELQIRHTLEHAPSLAEAAQMLGIDQATLYRKRKKLGLNKD